VQGEDVEDADSLAWLYELIKEGRAAGYLTQSVPIAINTVGWEPNCTPLHYAAAKGIAQAVAALLRASSVVIDVRTKDQYGRTPLHFAAYEGNLGAAQLLVEGYKQRNKLSEIDAHDKEGMSPLQYAAGGPWGCGPNRDVAELLVANGADPKQCLGKDRNITLVGSVSSQWQLCDGGVLDRRDCSYRTFSRRRRKEAHQKCYEVGKAAKTHGHCHYTAKLLRLSMSNAVPAGVHGHESGLQVICPIFPSHR
jgi:Ankyrin repeats (3 copies)